MPIFAAKKLLLEETFGEKLHQRRNYKKLKIEDISKALNIQSKYLIALEENDLDQLPEGLYGKNFLKQYANFLNLDSKELLNDWEKQTEQYSRQDPFSQKVVKAHKFIVFPKIIRNFLLILLVIACFLYLVFYFKNIISPPRLIVSNPPKNILISNKSIVIQGWAEPHTELKINNENILNNNTGYFSKEINLKKGLNNITISAKKKHSQSKIITREILVE